ncbi:MAG: HlyD family efflux transporter periplasmic adaptor subunit [Lachnospiraceae bacterium]|nr:HlyD family efflux transporter periplasmic adaptor subunit [Lachnospiraceae bacterium]
MKTLRKHKKLFIFLCIVAVLIIFLIVKMVSIQRQRSYAYVQPFSDLKMSGDDFSDTLDGTVTNENAQSISLDPEKTVGQVYVKAGDTVKKGDSLFSYNSDDLTSQLNAQNEVISSSTAQLDIQNKLLAYYKGLKPIKEDANTDTDDQASDGDSDSSDNKDTEDSSSDDGGQDSNSENSSSNHSSGTNQNDSETDDRQTDSTDTDNSGSAEDTGSDSSMSSVSSQALGLRALLSVSSAGSRNVNQSGSSSSDSITSVESEVVNPNGVTEEEKAELIKSTTEDINNLQQSINSAKIDLQSLQQQIDDCTVKALVDGKIASINDAETSVSSGTPFITISSETGIAVKGYVDEFTKNKIKAGDQIKVSNYMNNTEAKATITYISDFPSSDENTPQYSSVNNVSYYEFDAYLKDGNGFNPDDGVSISLVSDKKTSALSRGYVRKDKKGSYCLVSRKGRLEKVYVETQKTMDPGTILIVSGLKNSDLIAFPYSKTGYVGNKTTRKSQRSIVERILY